MREADKCRFWLNKMAKYGNLNSKSDVEVGAKSLQAGIWGAYRNVLINLSSIDDDGFREEVKKETNKIVKRSTYSLRVVVSTINKRKV
jgi:glutamate formiminotransferase/formiminotetrahydrofolate cyclodeaminase